MNHYDYIIYGMGYPSLLLLTELKRRNKSVLMINKYGFPGDLITESLACFQQYDIPNDNSLTYNLINEVVSGHKGYFYRDDNYLVVNPEYVKFQLQKQITNLADKVLLHVVPLMVNEEENRVLLTLSGKEGNIEFTSGKVIDTTFNQLLLKSTIPHMVSNKLLGASIYTSLYAGDPLPEIYPVGRNIKLEDGRGFVSFHNNVSKTVNESNFFDLLHNFNISLEASGSRIQVMPTGFITEFTPQINSPSSRLYHLNSLLKNSEPETEFLRCFELENLLHSSEI